MAERLRRAQPVSLTNHVKARQSLIERAVTWLANESGWARRKRSAICRGKLCGGFIIFEQCCPCAPNGTGRFIHHTHVSHVTNWLRQSIVISHVTLHATPTPLSRDASFDISQWRTATNMTNGHRRRTIERYAFAAKTHFWTSDFTFGPVVTMTFDRLTPKCNHFILRLCRWLCFSWCKFDEIPTSGL